MFNNIFEAQFNVGFKVIHELYSHDFKIYDQNE